MRGENALTVYHIVCKMSRVWEKVFEISPDTFVIARSVATKLPLFRLPQSAGDCFAFCKRLAMTQHLSARAQAKGLSHVIKIRCFAFAQHDIKRFHLVI